MSNKKRLTAVDLLPENILMGGRSFAHRWQALGLNMRSYQYWMYRLRTVAMSAFEWTGLDELGIDSRFVEYCMLNWGMGGFFELRRGSGSYAFAQATPMSRLNLYWNPNKIKLIPANGSIGWTRHAWYWAERIGTKDAIVHKPDAIVLWDNLDRTPILPLLESFARRLENIDRKIDININAQATPYIMDVDERQRQDAINLYQQITGNEPMIIANRNRSELLQPNVLNLDAPFVADKMDDELVKIWYRALTMLGQHQHRKARTHDRRGSNRKQRRHHAHAALQTRHPPQILRTGQRTFRPESQCQIRSAARTRRIIRGHGRL